MKYYVLCASLIISLPTLSFADCVKGEKILFACTTTKNKKIEVCDAGKTINYAFGKVGVKPELALNVPQRGGQHYAVGRYRQLYVLCGEYTQWQNSLQRILGRFQNDGGRHEGARSGSWGECRN